MRGRGPCLAARGVIERLPVIVLLLLPHLETFGAPILFDLYMYQALFASNSSAVTTTSTLWAFEAFPLAYNIFDNYWANQTLIRIQIYHIATMKLT